VDFFQKSSGQILPPEGSLSSATKHICIISQKGYVISDQKLGARMCIIGPCWTCLVPETPGNPKKHGIPKSVRNLKSKQTNKHIHPAARQTKFELEEELSIPQHVENSAMLFH